MKFFLIAVNCRLSVISKKRLGQVKSQFITENRKSFIRNACSGLFGLIMLFLNIGCQDEAPPPGALRLEIDTQTSQPLRHALYGFNTNMISGDYGYLDEDFVTLTKELAPKTLRFPGGTVGNFYHWEHGGLF